MSGDGNQQAPRRRPSLLSLFAAALAGGLGAFGAPAAGTHTPLPPRGAQALPAAGAPDVPPN